MNALTPWNHAALDPAFGNLNRLVETFLRPQPRGREELSSRGWLPAVDVRETEAGFVVEAELAGLSKEDVEITFEDGTLRLQGERKPVIIEGSNEENEENREDSYRRVERVYGSFSRAFTLPVQIDAEKIQASFEHGVLTIELPRAEETRPRRINIG